MKFKVVSLIILVVFVLVAFVPEVSAASPSEVIPKVFKVGKTEVISYLPDDVPIPDVQAFVEDKEGKRTLPTRVVHRILDRATENGEIVIRGETLVSTGVRLTDAGTLGEIPLPGAGEDSDNFSVVIQKQRTEWLQKDQGLYRYYQIQKNDAYWTRSEPRLTIPSNGAQFKTNVNGTSWSGQEYRKSDTQTRTPTWKTLYESYHSYTTSPHNSWEYCRPLVASDNFSLVITKIYDGLGEVGTISTKVTWVQP